MIHVLTKVSIATNGDKVTVYVQNYTAPNWAFYPSLLTLSGPEADTYLNLCNERQWIVNPFHYTNAKIVITYIPFSW